MKNTLDLVGGEGEEDLKDYFAGMGMIDSDTSCGNGDKVEGQSEQWGFGMWRERLLSKKP